jgi:predicted MFS family arabinose efflux permease
LFSGSISDVVGGRKVYLIGSFFLTITTVACGLSRTGIELILFRAAQGVAISLCLPSSVQLITSNIPTGTRRNVAFACLGASQPVGFSIGLVVGGIFVASIGWRFGYYLGAILVFLVFIISVFAVPVDRQTRSPVTIEKLRDEIDWIGCFILSLSLGSYSYVLSTLSAGISNFTQPTSIAFLILATLLIPAFGLHIRRQERRSRTTIIPPSLWSNVHFTSLCLVVFLVWSVFNAVEFFLTLFYQDVQHLSPIATSLRFLPMVVTGAFTNFLTGHLVSRIPANALVFAAVAISTISPLLMALVDPGASYWSGAFWATALSPIAADVHGQQSGNHAILPRQHARNSGWGIQHHQQHRK